MREGAGGVVRVCQWSGESWCWWSAEREGTGGVVRVGVPIPVSHDLFYLLFNMFVPV